ncbi:MAG: glycoside hydrolase family 2, partial [Bacteroidales bacterium]|nr:glycoside hydrolase family 2 [Bacteroidales bacterium]
ALAALALITAIVPGTVLNNDVFNKKVPEPYYGLNNKVQKGLIPDISQVGRDYYTRWFRTEFEVPADYAGKQIWLQFDGINYHAEVWVNGNLLSSIHGMFVQDYINVTDFVKPGAKAALAVKVIPVDVPGTWKKKDWGAFKEFHNGGDGNIGLNTTMLMSIGWDFTFMDGIRDRNTGIWRSIYLYATGEVALRHPFVKSELRHPDYGQASETVSVEVANPTFETVECEVYGTINWDIRFSKKVRIARGCTEEVLFTPEEFSQLVIDRPRLWWPVNKGPQNIYDLDMAVYVKGKLADSLHTSFGIREITSDTNTPDHSRVFYVNGKRIFIRGTNWIPEAMLRSDDRRTETELRYTRQCGINLIRFWGGGIAESDYFYELCDRYGILIWQEFWMTGDTRHPQDKGVYMNNVESTGKRIRNHPSVAYYVCSNESTEMPGMRELLAKLDGTRGYQMQSECDGIHDGSPYKQVNPMRHYENTASDRGSRIDGFNPEYGAPVLPLVESLRLMMDEKDLWPINREVWDYHDGNGFSQVSTLYKQMTDEYGTSNSIEEFSKRAQLVAAVNSHSIWECWNYNKFGYGDRWCSGLLFWFHNSPVPQVCGHIYDWYLEPTAALYHTANALEPVHVQYDFLKNTVSVVNDYYTAFEGGSVTATVYDLNSRKVWERRVDNIRVPEDGVANDVMTVDFSQATTDVQFLKLRLTDADGKSVSENFYWRSNSKYEGKNTLTGPCTAGFQQLNSMKQVSLKYTTKVIPQKTPYYLVEVTVRNNSKQIAFFNQLHLFGTDNQPIRGAFYSDNFFTLLPGESKTVTIDCPLYLVSGKGLALKVSGWNVPEQVFKLK